VLVHAENGGVIEALVRRARAEGRTARWQDRLTPLQRRVAERLADALEATWMRDPQLYYEDGFQEFVDRGGVVGTAPIGPVDWVEVDDHDDLGRARELACLY